GAAGRVARHRPAGDSPLATAARNRLAARAPRQFARGCVATGTDCLGGAALRSRRPRACGGRGRPARSCRTGRAFQREVCQRNIVTSPFSARAEGLAEKSATDYKHLENSTLAEPLSLAVETRSVKSVILRFSARLNLGITLFNPGRECHNEN